MSSTLSRVRSRTTVRLLLVCLLAALLVPLLPEGASQAAAARPAISPVNPMAGETVVLAGHLSSRIRRTVYVEYSTGHGWKRTSKGRTNASGHYSLTVRMASIRMFVRVYAPKAKVTQKKKTKKYPKVRTSIRTMTPVAVSAWISSTGPVGQTPDTRYALRTPVVATFRPVRQGRPVVLQRFTGGRWVNAATGSQNARGEGVFFMPAGAATFRAVTTASRGAAARYTPNTAVRDWGAPDFVDDFNGTRLDPTKWGYRQLGLRHGQRMHAHSAKEAVSVSGGAAHLKVVKLTKAKPNMGRTSGYMNGHIGTDGAFAFKYGMAAARVRFPRQRGQHGSFWMQSRPEGLRVPNNPRVSGAEIDVVEYFGDGRKDGGVGHAVYWPNASGGYNGAGGILNSDTLLGQGKTWWNSYHVYSVEWSPEQYIFRVDGREVMRTRNGVSGQNQYLILSQLTSDWEIPRLNDKLLPNTMDVDWVRVWDR